MGCCFSNSVIPEDQVPLLQHQISIPTISEPNTDPFQTLVTITAGLMIDINSTRMIDKLSHAQIEKRERMYKEAIDKIEGARYAEAFQRVENAINVILSCRSSDHDEDEDMNAVIAVADGKEEIKFMTDF